MPLKVLRTEPRYLAIQRYVQELIEGPDYAPGDNIPSERVLADKLGANRMTVRKAIDRLVAAGLLERNSTSGTRLPPPKVTRPLNPRTSLGISRLVQISGGTPASRLLYFEAGRASASVAARLRIDEGADLMIFRRLWMVDTTPFCIETSHIPAVRVPGLAAEDLTSGRSLNALLRERYGISVFSGEREIGVVHCNEQEAKLLQLAPGDAALVLRLVSADTAGRPIEYLRSINHPQLVLFRTEMGEAQP